jgi:hypothetical protein
MENSEMRFDNTKNLIFITYTLLFKLVGSVIRLVILKQNYRSKPHASIQVITLYCQRRIMYRYSWILR